MENRKKKRNLFLAQIRTGNTMEQTENKNSRGKKSFQGVRGIKEWDRRVCRVGIGEKLKTKLPMIKLGVRERDRGAFPKIRFGKE